MSDNNPEEKSPTRKLVHDLRSPLSVISLGLDTLRMMTEDKELLEVITMMQREGVEEFKKILDNA